jgi:hypothetical protein
MFGPSPVPKAPLPVTKYLETLLYEVAEPPAELVPEVPAVPVIPAVPLEPV